MAKERLYLFDSIADDFIAKLAEKAEAFERSSEQLAARFDVEAVLLFPWALTVRALGSAVIAGPSGVPVRLSLPNRLTILRSTTTAPGISPSRPRCSDGRMSTSNAPAATCIAVGITSFDDCP